jgi:GntR family transcriptional regulator, sialic acid-inducible nan operon repressor
VFKANGQPLGGADMAKTEETAEKERPVTAFSPIRRLKLSEEAAIRIEALIQDGTFSPGALLPSERELMKILGVGRTSIREALYALNRMGLIRLRNGERPLVTTPTPETLVLELSGAARYFLSRPDGAVHFQDARALFEVGIARAAASRCTHDDIVRLRTALDANYAARGDLSRFERTDVAFHYVLVTIARNPIYTAVHDALVGWLTDQRTLSLRAPGAEHAALEGHQQIFEAVSTRNPDAAGEAMKEHLRSVAALIVQAMEDNGHATRRTC